MIHLEVLLLINTDTDVLKWCGVKGKTLERLLLRIQCSISLDGLSVEAETLS